VEGGEKVANGVPGNRTTREIGRRKEVLALLLKNTRDVCTVKKSMTFLASLLSHAHQLSEWFSTFHSPLLLLFFVKEFSRQTSKLSAVL